MCNKIAHSNCFDERNQNQKGRKKNQWFFHSFLKVQHHRKEIIKNVYKVIYKEAAFERNKSWKEEKKKYCYQMCYKVKKDRVQGEKNWLKTIKEN